MAEEAPAVDVNIENGKELAETSQEEQSTNVVDSETSDVGLMIVEYIKEVEAMPPRLAKLQVAVSDLQHPGEASRIYDEEALPSSMYADEGAPAVEIEKLEKIDTFPRNEAVSTYFRSASLNPEDEMEEVKMVSLINANARKMLEGTIPGRQLHQERVQEEGPGLFENMLQEQQELPGSELRQALATRQGRSLH
eukprot:gene2553-3305_t